MTSSHRGNNRRLRNRRTNRVGAVCVPGCVPDSNFRAEKTPEFFANQVNSNGSREESIRTTADLNSDPVFLTTSSLLQNRQAIPACLEAAVGDGRNAERRPKPNFPPPATFAYECTNSTLLREDGWEQLTPTAARTFQHRSSNRSMVPRCQANGRFLEI